MLQKQQKNPRKTKKLYYKLKDRPQRKSVCGFVKYSFQRSCQEYGCLHTYVCMYINDHLCMNL